MNKRLIYLVLVFVMVLSIVIFNGCAKTETTTKDETSTMETKTTEQENTPEATKEPPTQLLIMTQSNPATIDCSEMPVWQQAEQITNVTIEWDQVRSGWEEKKALVLASGDLPDIFLGGLTDGDIISNIDSFVELSDLIEQFAPNVQYMFEKNGATLNLSTFPGKGVYSLPLVFGFMPKSAVTMMINKSWLDTLGLEVPQTLEELSDVLLAFYEGDPNGNGEADEIPLDWPSEAYVHAHDIFVLTGAYGVVDNQTDDMQVVKDGVVSFLYVEDAYYKIIQYLHDLYSNNLINPEVFTNDYSAAGVLSAQGEIARVGVTTGWSPASRVGQYADQYIVLDQLKVSADSEITPLWPSNPAQLNVFPNVCELTIACEEPEAAMRLINHMYSYDFTIQDYYGSFPDNTIKYDDGTYEILVPEDGTTIEQNKWENALVNYGPGFFSDELESMTKAPGEILGRVEIDKVYDDNRPELVNIFPIVKYDAETSEELIYLKTDIKKLVVQKMAEWVVNGGIEEEWENYLSDLDKMGLPRMQEIYQKAYDENHY